MSKMLIDRWAVQGKSSYPDNHELFQGLEPVVWNDNEYFYTDYEGDLPLETGDTAAYEASLVATTGIRKITVGSFRRRIPFEARVAIEESTDTMVKVMDKDLMSSSFVDLDFPEVILGVNHLVDLGILTDTEAADLLADGSKEEEYKGV